LVTVYVLGACREILFLLEWTIIHVCFIKKPLNQKKWMQHLPYLLIVLLPWILRWKKQNEGLFYFMKCWSNCAFLILLLDFGKIQPEEQKPITRIIFMKCIDSKIIRTLIQARQLCSWKQRKIIRMVLVSV